MGRWTIVNGLLGLFLVALVWQISQTWSRSLPAVEIVQRPSGEATARPKGEGRGKRGDRNAAAKTAEQSPEAMVAAIVDRDLFDPTRAKLTEEAKVAQVAVVAPPTNVTVVGIRAWGKDREVFLTENNQQRRLRIGDQISGYTVKRILPTEVTLTSPTGDPLTMSLNVEKGKATGPLKPGAAPPKPGAPGTMPPSAGVHAGASPAAGIQPKPTPPVPGAGVPPVQPKPAAPVPGVPAAASAPAPPSQLPADVRDRLEQLKEQRGQNRMGQTK